MPVAVAQLELESRVASLLMGVAFAFLLKQKDSPERLSPATRMQQTRELLRQVPVLLRGFSMQRRALSLELNTLLRKGPTRYLEMALRELQGLAH